MKKLFKNVSIILTVACASLAFTACKKKKPTTTKSNTSVTTKNNGSTTNSKTKPTTNTTQASKKNYKINFETYGGTKIDSLSIQEGANIDGIISPTKIGCTFIGWYLDEAFNEEFNLSVMPSNDITLYAKYVTNKYTINFITDKTGMNVDSIEAYYNEDITLPLLEDPGYTFLGWYSDIEKTNKVEFAKMPGSDYTLYAKWEEVNYTIEYETNGGVNDTNNITSYTINSDTFTLLDATKEGYDFLGWYYTDTFTPGTRLKVIDTTVTLTNLTLYAKYQIHNYTINYITDGAIHSNPSTSNVNNEAIALTDASKNYCNFLGWYLEPTYDTQITEIPAHLDHNLNVYAKWEYTSYTINYNLNGGENDSNNITSFNVDTDFTFYEPTRNGYKFEGWYTSSAFGESSKITKINKDRFASFSIYAKWTAITYNVTYILDGGDNDTRNQNTMLYDSGLKLYNATKAHYDFLGWYDNASLDGDAITEIKNPTKDAKLFAKFRLTTYTLSFITDEGSAVENIKYNINSLPNLSLIESTPNDDNYIFAYWKYGDKVFTDITEENAGNYTLTAFYAEAVYTVMFVDYDDTVLAEIEVGKNDAAIYPYDTPTRAYTDYIMYKFKEWDTNVTSITGNITAKAIYDEIQYINFEKVTPDEGDAYYKISINGSEYPEVLNLPSSYKGAEDLEALPVKEIAENGFAGLTSVVEITIPESITIIGSKAFSNMNNLAIVNYNAIEVTSSNAQIYFQSGTYAPGNGFVVNIGENVISIPDYAFSTNNIAYLTHVLEINFLGDKLTTIGANAFSYNTLLEEIVIPDCVTTIKDYAFRNSSNLKRITYSNNLTYLGTFTLGSCSSIEYISVPFIGVKNGETYNYTKFDHLFGSPSSSNNSCPYTVKEVVITKATTIPAYAFYYNQYIEKITLNEEIKSIGNYAFYYCLNLKQLNYNCIEVDDLTTNNNVFVYAGNSATEFVFNIGSEVTSIPAYLFYTSSSSSYYSKITEINFTNATKLEKIGTYAFAYCQKLTSLTIPDTITNMGAYAFYYCIGIKTLDVRNSSSFSSYDVFAYLTGLDNVYMSSTNTNFGFYLFYGCSNIINVYFDGTYKQWIDIDFKDEYCNPMYYASRFLVKDGDTYNDLDELDLSDMDITYIDSNTFTGFKSVKKVILPDTLELIESNAFSGMYRLTEIVFPETLTTIESYAFSNCYSLKNIVIPNSVTEIGSYAFQDCANLESVTLPDTLNTLPDGLFSGCISLVTVDLPDSLEIVPSYIFQNMEKLKTVTIPSGVKEIDYYAFYNSSIESIIIPASVIKIDSSAFYNCKNLVSVTYESGSNLQFIGGSAFYGCPITEIVLPDGVEIIDSSAFDNCTKTTYIYLPSSIIYIGNNAFNNTKSVEEIDYYTAKLEYNVVYYDKMNGYSNSYYNTNSGIFDNCGRDGDGFVLNIKNTVKVLPEYFFYGSSSSPAKVISIVFEEGLEIEKLTNYIQNSAQWPNYYSYAFNYVDSLTDVYCFNADYIPYYFLSYVKNVENVYVPNTVTYIDSCAFYNADIENIYLPNTIEKINSGAFYSYKDNVVGYMINNIYFDGTKEELGSIKYRYSNSEIYRYCNNLYYKDDGEYVKYIPTEEEEITYADEDTIISNSYDGLVFTDDNPLVIPANILYFKENPFKSDMLQTDKVYYDGTLEDWCKIKFEYSSCNPMYYFKEFYYLEDGEYKLLTDLVIPDSITKINDYAFCNYYSLTSVDTNNATKIGQYAFATYQNEESNKLITVIIGDACKVVGYEAFYQQRALSNITFGNNVEIIDDYAFYYCRSLKNVVLNEGIKEIGYEAFYYCDGLESINIPDTVETIEQYAFAYTGPISELELGENVLIIDDYAFYNSNIKSVKLNKNLKAIGRYCFEYSKIENIILDSENTSLTFIPSYTFYECYSLKNVVLNGNVKEIDEYAFEYCYALETFECDSLEKIGRYAFYYCEELKDFTFNEGLKEIGYEAFYYCISLGSVILPSTVEAIGDYAFSCCYSLNKIVVNGKFDRIPSSCFYNCYGLTDLTIGDNVKYIGSCAFEYANRLFTVTIPKNIVEIGSSAFYGCNNLKIVYNKSDLELVPGHCEINDDKYSYVSYYADYVFTDDGETCYVNIDDMIFVITDNNDGTYSANLFTYIGDASTIVLPSEIQVNNEITGYTDVTIESYYINQYAFAYNRSITNVTIPSSVLAVVDYAFYYCTNLESVTIECIENTTGEGPAYIGPTYIGTYAFAYTNLYEFTIPNSVSGMSGYTFYNCKNLEEVTIGDALASVPNYCFAGCIKLTNVNYGDNVKAFSPYVFDGCSSLEAFKFNDGVVGVSDHMFSNSGIKSVDFNKLTYIPDYCFYNCYNLTSVVISKNITTINQYAFYNCINLASVTLNSNITTINSGVFYGCISLESIDLSNVTYIDSEAFDGCTELSNVVFSNELTYIGQNAFRYAKFTSIVLPNSVTGTGTYAFAYCDSLISFKFGDGITVANSNILYGCSNLTSVDFNKVTTIGSYALASCSSIEEIVVPDTVTTIETYAFYNSEKLEKITLGKAVTAIGQYAFYYCSSLNNIYYDCARLNDFYGGQYSPFNYLRDTECSITFGPNVERIPNYMFAAYSTTSYGTTYRYQPNIKTLVFETSDAFTTIGQYVLNNNTNITSLVIPESVTTIETHAFYSSSLNDVELPTNLETIGIYAFGYTNIEEITLNGYVDTYAFYYCNNLKKLTVGNAIIYANAFYSCPNLEEIYISKDARSFEPSAFAYLPSIKKVTLEEGLTSLSERIFYSCTGLEEINIPASLTTIPQYAFAYCSNLTKVTLNEGITSIGAYAFNSTPIRTIIIPSTITTIGNYAFNYCNGLYTVRNLSSLGITKGNSGFGYVAYYAYEVLGVDDESTLTIDGDFVYGFKNNKYYLYAYLGNDKKVTLPETFIYDDVTITSYNVSEYAFIGNNTIEEIIISDSVTSIGANAFAYCTNLKTVEIGSNCTSMGGNAFAYDPNITTIKLNSTYSASSTIFVNSCCNNDATVYIGANVTSIPNYFLYTSANYGKVKNVIFEEGSNLKTIGQYAFGYCSYLESINIPDTVETINAYAFYQCTNLKNITIPSSLTTLGGYAFYYCTSLVGVVLPEGLKVINNYTFYYCTSLEEVVLPSTITTIGNNAFYYCSMLESINFESGITSIGTYAFAYTAIEEIILPNTITTLGTYAFACNTNLKKASLSSSLSTVVDSLFKECSNLEEVYIPDGVTSINSYAFYNCYNLSKLTYNGNVTTIGTYAFYNTSKLEEFNFGSKVTTIGQYAFGSSGIKEANLPNSLISIGTYAFSSSALESVVIPTSITLLDTGVFYNTNIVELVIPNNITQINANAITTRELKKLVIPDSVTVFNYSSLDFQKLEELYLGSGIAGLSFSGDNLTKLYISSEEYAYDLLYKYSFNKLIANVTELYILDGLTVTTYVSENYNLDSSVDIYGGTFNKYVIK